jgi:ATP-dependent protease Clp ATPase subunit
MNTEQVKFKKEMSKLFEIFTASEGELRPHFILVGPSGSGKTWNISNLAQEFGLGFLDVNAAQLTKEGTAGSSLSKAIAPLAQMQQKLTVCLIDEWDKLFIAGNSNSEMAHETTLGVQNEFLKVVESDTASVFGDYGKYVNISVKNVLFVFAGAFNGEEDVDLDRLREIGVKTEFLGRVGLVFNTEKVSLATLIETMKASFQLSTYLQLFSNVKREDVEKTITEQLTDCYDNNTLGFRVITTLINQYFIKGPNIGSKESKKVTFQKVLSLD